ncbi:hypothetical protein MKW94_004113 [Papaver nudicaule]|uniref:RING-type domain-containing protein n=1 Tax=Papaver nudicaule TaxID=74823 RepID=A0AA41S8P0_PAPNU|nr:hypothetical protein [Papaver nudicaule]
METIQQNLNKLFKTSNHSNATNSRNYFTCEICMEPVPLKGRFRNMEVSGCFHPYCSDCVAKYIETKVIHDNISDIKFPNTNCVALLDTLSCRSILPKLFESWCRVLCESAVLLDATKGGFVHGRCFCPNLKCSELILNECEGSKTDVKRSDCPNCKEVFCFRKNNHQCRQTGAITIDIDVDKNDKWVRCPNCNLYIQREFIWVRVVAAASIADVEPNFVMIAESGHVCAKKNR